MGSWELDFEQETPGGGYFHSLTVVSFSADHTMGRSNQPFVYVPHKRRGPISAEFKSPGPAAFNIPGTIGNHGPKESTKATAPAFTFGGKSELKNKFKTPAPNAYDSEKGEDYLHQGTKHTFGLKPEIKNKFKTPAPNAYDSEKGEEYLEGGIKHTFGVKPEIPNKFKTPAPNAYSTENGEDYLEGGIKHSFGIKPELKNKFKTPAPNVYDTDKGENYLEGVKALSMGERLKEAKKFLTPAPNKYEAVIPEDKPSFAFGVKHSPYLYSGRELGRERFVATKTESVSNGHSNGDSGANGEFRQRSGTFTRDKPTVLSTVA